MKVMDMFGAAKQLQGARPVRPPSRPQEEEEEPAQLLYPSQLGRSRTDVTAAPDHGNDEFSALLRSISSAVCAQSNTPASLFQEQGQPNNLDGGAWGVGAWGLSQHAVDVQGVGGHNSGQGERPRSTQGLKQLLHLDAHQFDYLPDVDIPDLNTPLLTVPGTTTTQHHPRGGNSTTNSLHHQPCNHYPGSLSSAAGSPGTPVHLQEARFNVPLSPKLAELEAVMHGHNFSAAVMPPCCPAPTPPVPIPGARHTTPPATSTGMAGHGPGAAPCHEIQAGLFLVPSAEYQYHLHAATAGCVGATGSSGCLASAPCTCHSFVDHDSSESSSPFTAAAASIAAAAAAAAAESSRFIADKASTCAPVSVFMSSALAEQQQQQQLQQRSLRAAAQPAECNTVLLAVGHGLPEAMRRPVWCQSQFRYIKLLYKGYASKVFQVSR